MSDLWSVALADSVSVRRRASVSGVYRHRRAALTAHNRFMGTYVGFDPGGVGAFGWAAVSGEAWPLRLVARGIAAHAQSAFDAAMKRAGTKINAVGIDAPLFWIPAGDRHADKTLRKAIKGLGSHGATVQSVNSLRGACLIQGLLVAMLCQKKGIPLTETHPKALLWLLRLANRERPPGKVAIDDLGDYVVGSGLQGASEHERDAVLSAAAAFAMKSRQVGWQDLYALEPNNPSTLLVPPPGYWMPL